ncbi:MAG: transcriptional regulator [Clostridia bacterium]|nr:transcriptional regulator [Clostridia bacterium]
MGRKGFTREGVLGTLEILKKYSDEDHYLSASDIVAKMEQLYGIKVERKSIMADVDTLNSMGYEVESTRGKGYRLRTRSIKSAELKLLIDAVMTAKFIDEKESRALAEKLKNMVSTYEKAELERNIRIVDNVKTGSDYALQAMDKTNSAINQDVAFTCKYMQWDRNKKLVPKYQGQIYTLSPWQLIWEGENYYVLAYHHEKEAIKTYRVDKLSDINLLSKAREGGDEYKQNYEKKFGRKSFLMFDGELKKVKIKFPKELLGVMIDRFGTEPIIFDCGEGYYFINTEVVVSNQFYAWIWSLQDVEILEPTDVREAFLERTENILKKYEK